MDIIRPNGIIGTDHVRIDGAAKVTGRAMYGADTRLPNAAFAALATAAIASGRVREIDETAARAMPGVLDVLTHKNVGRAVRPGKSLMEGGHMAHSVAPLAADRVYFAGQIVAVVIAETQEIAEAGVSALVVRYDEDQPTATFDTAGTKIVKANSLGEGKAHVGDVEKGLAQADAVVDAWYETPAQHHNPLELFQCTCEWKGGKLTVWESTQNVRGTQFGLAKQLGVRPANVRVISPYIGGAFGSRGELGQHTALIALAAQRLGRAVKLVASRRECFTLRTFRAETRHHLRLGADAKGALTALEHESWEICGRKDRFAVAGSDATTRLYACPNVWSLVHNVEADRQAPGFMRAPPEVPYLFAMESAMDELAYALKLDPLELRRRNDTMVETVTGRPYTSRSLLRCIDHGAELFGWSARTPGPRSMADGDELVGWGYATAFYPTQVGPAHCRVTLRTDLHATVEVGTHEIGTGVRTVIAQTAADLLGLHVEDITVRIGDSDLPAAPMSAGSNSTASVCSVVAKACDALRERIAQAAAKDRTSSLQGADPFHVRLIERRLVCGQSLVTEPLSLAVERVSKGSSLVQEATNNPHGSPPVIGPMLVNKGTPIMLGGERLKDRMQFAFGAQFVEVRIDRWTGQIRVPRITGVFAAGRIMNPRTARAQLQGGQVWGIASALHESTELDLHHARYVNADLAEYHVPVNADIERIETVMLDEVDTLVNPLGIKGVGELGTTGVNAAIANAVFHATGTRIRKLPIRVGGVTFA